MRTYITVALVGAVLIAGIGGGSFYFLSSTTRSTLETIATSYSTTTININSTSHATTTTSTNCETSLTDTPLHPDIRFESPLVFDSLSDVMFGLGSNGTSQNVYEFNPEGNDSVTAVATLNTGSYAIVYDSLTNSLYLSSYGIYSSILVINASNFSMIKNISLATPPSNLVFDPDNGEIYVASPRADAVYAINGSTNSIVSEIGTTYGAGEFAYVPQNQEMYISTGSISDSSTEVDVINTHTNTIVSRIPIPTNGSTSITFDQANGDIYLASYLSNNVTIISSSSNRIVGNVMVPYSPDKAFYNPTDHEVYVATNQTGGAISIIQSNTNAVSTPLSGMGGIIPFGFSYDPSNGDLYLFSANTNEVDELSATPVALSCLNLIKPSYAFSISNPSIFAKPNNLTFSTFVYNVTVNQNALIYYNGTLSYLTHFSGNPQWMRSSNGSWTLTNSTALEGSSVTPLWKVSTHYLNVTMNTQNKALMSANNTGQVEFYLYIGGQLPPGYYGLVLNVYIELSQYPTIPVFYSGYIPIEVLE